MALLFCFALFASLFLLFAFVPKSLRRFRYLLLQCFLFPFRDWFGGLHDDVKYSQAPIARPMAYSLRL